MTSLFHQKQTELLVAVARVEELSNQLEGLRSNSLEPSLPLLPHHHNMSSTAELERLYKELQVRIFLANIKLYFAVLQLN